MKRGAWFWGAALIVLGVIFLLESLKILPGGAGRYIWPAALILVGVWILWGALGRRRSATPEHVVIPLEGANQAMIKVRHGAGKLDIHGGAGPGELLSGDFAGGLDYRSRREGDTLETKLRVPEQGFSNPWNWDQGIGWSFGVTMDVPVGLDCKLGANEATLDLTQLRLTSLHLETGASETRITMPANAGYTRADLHSGVGAVHVTIPAGVAARILTSGGLAEITVDTARFPLVGEHTYQSADYETATNRVDLDAETSLGAVEIR